MQGAPTELATENNVNRQAEHKTTHPNLQLCSECPIEISYINSEILPFPKTLNLPEAMKSKCNVGMGCFLDLGLGSGHSGGLRYSYGRVRKRNL